MGFDVLPPFVAHGIQGGGIAYEQRAVFEQHLGNLKRNWAERLNTLDSAQPIPFTGWQDWDRDGVLRTDHPSRWA
jgi:NAD(P)H dehydrogenase (quinone)